MSRDRGRAVIIQSAEPGTPGTRLLFVLFLLLLLGLVLSLNFGDQLRGGAVRVRGRLFTDHFLLLPVLDALPSPSKQFPPIGRGVLESR